jgi:hypothetical protein
MGLELQNYAVIMPTENSRIIFNSKYINGLKVY